MTGNLSLHSLLPWSMTDYYRYSGSLTTPPCYESVVWSVFVDAAIDISEEQVYADYRQIIGRLSTDNRQTIGRL